MQRLGLPLDARDCPLSEILQNIGDKEENKYNNYKTAVDSHRAIELITSEKWLIDDGIVDLN